MSNLVVVNTYYDVPSAFVAQSYLESHGVLAVLLDWHLVTNAWYYTVAVQGIRLCTVSTSLAEARALLGEVDPTDDPEFSLEANPMDYIIAALAMFLAGIPFPVRRPRYFNRR